jgi:hypothetical protein
MHEPQNPFALCAPAPQISTAIRLQDPAPIEDLAAVDELPHLSGRQGTNRAAGHRQISADTDRQAVLAWLARCADSPNTLANSRREAERLLLWALIEAGKPLSSLTHEDLLRYQRFLADQFGKIARSVAPVQRLAAAGRIVGHKQGRGGSVSRGHQAVILQ